MLYSTNIPGAVYIVLACDLANLGGESTMYVKTTQWNIDFLNPWFFECFDNPNQILHSGVARTFSEVGTTHQMLMSPRPQCPQRKGYCKPTHFY